MPQQSSKTGFDPSFEVKLDHQVGIIGLPRPDTGFRSVPAPVMSLSRTIPRWPKAGV